MKEFKLYYIDEDYLNYLKQFDDKINFFKDKYDQYIGVAVEYNNFYYFMPIIIPKPLIKKDSDDLFLIDNGNLGVVVIREMIPTPFRCVTELLPSLEDNSYKDLLCKQFDYINQHNLILKNKINNFISLNSGNNLSLLEEKCLKYKN